MLAKPRNPKIWYPSGAPVAWYLMDTPRGTRPGDTGDVADLTGGVSAGVRHNGCTWSPGPRGNSLAFDGSAGYVDCGSPATLNITGNLTISAWVYFTGSSGNYYFITSNLDGSSGGFEFFHIPAGVVALQTANGSYHGLSDGIGLAANAWTFVAATLDVAGYGCFYHDGVLSATASLGANPIGSSTSPFHIGERPGTTGSYNWPGTIDDLQIYNRVLSPAEIARDYADPFWRLRRRLRAVAKAPPSAATLALAGSATAASVSFALVNTPPPSALTIGAAAQPGAVTIAAANTPPPSTLTIAAAAQPAIVATAVTNVPPPSTLAIAASAQPATLAITASNVLPNLRNIFVSDVDWIF